MMMSRLIDDAPRGGALAVPDCLADILASRMNRQERKVCDGRRYFGCEYQTVEHDVPVDLYT